MTRARLVVIGPVPPPRHGVTISTALVLANPFLREQFELIHLDTSDQRGIENIGAWDLTNVRVGVAAVARLIPLLRRGRGIVYLPISQSAPGFLRDSLFVLAARLRGWRVAAHLRGSELNTFYAAAAPPLRFWIRLTLARIDSLAVMGESVRGAVDGLLPPSRIAVVPNGTPDPSPNGHPRDASTVLFLSNLKRRKGIVESVEAALQVLERCPSARFLFVGSWEDAELERTLHERAAGAGDRLRFLPPVDDEAKHELLASASVFLFTPREPEGHPRVVLEALAAGVPIVTTDRGTIRETVADGECGYVLADPVPEDISAAIVRLLEDDELRTRLAIAARERYLSRYTQERADAALATWLARVAGARDDSAAAGAPA